MALPLMLGICLVAGVACFLTYRATKAANKVAHDGDNVNTRPPAPAISSNNLTRRSSAAPATSSDNDLNRRPSAAPATSPVIDLNRRSPAAPATSSDNDLKLELDDNDVLKLEEETANLIIVMLGICLVAGVACFLTDRATKAANKVAHDGDNVNTRPQGPATSSNNLNRRSPADPGTGLDDNIDVLTPLIDENYVLKLEEEAVNLSGEGWWRS